ncbi:uncharacterized protein LOC120639528 isoform X1 [Panicum virgatum]|uniref:uncharacterized protein LOC120639528 isoform X1 n=1 Tax=Panicum virgatum TaxID=38727 RepID=UPI0019D6982C|nr:uncharacterized protein LOC120639528 isoform X1 [Panicum virgatum]
MPTLVLAPGRCQGLGWPSCCGSCGTTCHGCHSSSPLVSPPRQALPSPPGRALPSPPSAPLLPRCLLPPATGQAKDCRTRRRTENGISKQQVRKHNWLRRAGNWKDDYNKNKKLVVAADCAGALDVIDDLQNLLDTDELAGLYCFRHIRDQLGTSLDSVNSILSAELVHAAVPDGKAIDAMILSNVERKASSPLNGTEHEICAI